MRPDAQRWLRQDHARYIRPEAPAPERKSWRERAFDRELAALRREQAALRRALTEVKFALLVRKGGFGPDQPRVPAGNPDGGQWTSGGGGGSETEFSGNRRRLGPPGQGTPAQMARFELANARAKDAIVRVRDVDPNWKPQPSAYGTGIESAIRRANDLVAEAEARIDELQRAGIGPGRYAGASIPARGPERDFTAAERREINRIGSETGCHTCGTFKAGTGAGNYIPDHQPPSGWSQLNRQQRLYPHCLTCSLRQGGWIRTRGPMR
jgi:hypothetical protein